MYIDGTMIRSGLRIAMITAAIASWAATAEAGDAEIPAQVNSD